MFRRRIARQSGVAAVPQRVRRIPSFFLENCHGEQII
jgi:hypothetical protein